MNKEQREQIDLNLSSRSLEYIRQILKNQTFVNIKGNQNELLKECEKEHIEKCEMFENYIEALRYDANINKKIIYRYKREKEFAEKEKEYYKNMYDALYNKKESEIQKEYEKAYNTRAKFLEARKQDEIDNQVFLETRKLRTELEEQKKINEKWKAMYTGQCEANRILINKLENV